MNKNRQSIRLRGYDYSQSGAYFVTICVQDLQCLFGEMVNSKMVLNDAGQMIESIWSELPERFPHVKLDKFEIMPNHFHGIMVFRGGESCICPKTGEQSTGEIDEIDEIDEMGEHKVRPYVNIQ